MDKVTLPRSVIPSGEAWKEKRLKDRNKRKKKPEKKKDDAGLDNGNHIDRRA